MKLKYLELYGFKSFAEKTRLTFEKDISAIVGPNGSGKSNISDAVRWVLGEQSAKSLRGAKMEDVIFSGTETKKQMNMAQVSITIDNSDKSLPIAFEEVNVTRRVYRTGESEYLINNSQVRLKDVKELFLDTGIGKDGYSIIGQGRIDDILNGKSEERRYIFEEACGISKNKYKKTEAERKLVKNEENLNSLKSELKIKEQETEILRKQSENAKEGIRLTNLLEKMELSLLKQSVDKINIDMQKDRSDLEFLNINYDENTRRVSFLQERVKPTQEKIWVLEEKLQNSRQIISSNDKKQQNYQNDINIIVEKLKFYKNDIDRISKDIIRRDEKTEISKKLIEEKSNKKTFLENEKKKLLKDIEKIDEKSEEDKNTKLEITNQIAEIVRKINAKRNTLSDLNVDKSTKEQLDNSNKKLKENYIQEIGQLEHTISEKHKLKEKYLQKLSEIEEKIEKNSFEISELVDERELNNKEIENLSEKFNREKSIYLKKESERDILLNIYRSYEGYYKPVQNLLKETVRNSEISKKIVGVLAELIEVDSAYKTAVDVTMSSSLQNIVVGDENDAKYLIEYIKKHNFGRITFLPISKIEGSNYNISHPLIIDTLNKLVKYDGRIENIINHFLSRTVLVRNMDDAIKVSKDVKGFRIVTLEGEIINSWGAMVGGNIYKKETNSLINRKKELQNIEDFLNIKGKEIALVEKKIESFRKCHDDLMYELSIRDDANKKFIIEKNNISNNLRELEVERGFNENRLNEYKDLLEKAIESLREVDFSNIHELETEIKSIEIKYNDLMKKDFEISEVIMENDRNKIKLDSQSEILNRDYNLLINDIENLNIDIENEMKSKKFDERTLESIKLQNLESENKIVELSKSIDDLGSTHDELLKVIESLDSEVKKLKENISKDTSEINSLKENISELEKNKYRLELKIENSESKIDELHNNYMETYGSDMFELRKKLENAEIVKTGKKEVIDIKNQLSKIGYFNFDSIEQYNIAFEDLEFTRKQYDDLVSTRNDILNMIKTIEKDMITMFKNGFEKINRKFGEVFQILFDGGTASVSLDGDDVLSAGIEINAKPPGKKLKSLGLLSGGEKALTAVALLFSIFEINPAPFCVLDEIDAALDESNISRYIKYLKSMVENTQFIMITHRKVTMEMAEILYGVTMEEKGISKVITLALDKYRGNNV